MDISYFRSNKAQNLGGWTPHMKGGWYVRRLAYGYKFRILVSLRVFWAKRHHI